MSTSTSKKYLGNMQTITYHRPPTSSEIKFGYGATHYCDIPVDVCLNKDGKAKKWLIYYNQRWYY